jgi:hypothetical protein
MTAFPLFLSDASSNHRGMGSRSTLLKTFFSRGSVILRILGLPAAIFTLYWEIHGSPPATASLILHRIFRRLYLRTFVRIMSREKRGTTAVNDAGGKTGRGPKWVLDSSILVLRGAGHGARPLPPKSCTPTASSHTTTSRTSLCTPSSTLPMPHSRSKTTSQVDVVGAGKRLSLQFPIQTAAGSNSPSHSPRSRPQSLIAHSAIPSPEEIASPTETNILAVLAAQERYVLELKDDLVKAEKDLVTLKGHWANLEANKRRNEVRKVTQLQPVNTLIDISDDKDDVDGSNTWMQKEMERRKALLGNTKSSQRKVFSGSRHLRQLSLLSPDKAYAPSFPQPSDVHEEEPVSKQPEPPTRSSTSSDVPRDINDMVQRYDMGENISGMPTIQREQLIRAGTRMATDFKNGLFTFIEDIRQATVGDEAVNESGDGFPPSARDPLVKGARKATNGRPSLNRSASSKKSSQQTASIGDDFWSEHGLSEPKTSPMHNKKTHMNKPAQTPQKQARPGADEEEEWANWETPSDTYAQKPVDSSDESDAPSSTGPGSSRTSTRYHSKRHDSKASSLTTTSSNGHLDDPRESKRHSIPWPDLVKLSPNNLKRTASHLMKEWEKQLTPPPESRSVNHSHGDYMGRSDAPNDLI